MSTSKWVVFISYLMEMVSFKIFLFTVASIYVMTRLKTAPSAPSLQQMCWMYVLISPSTNANKPASSPPLSLSHSVCVCVCVGGCVTIKTRGTYL